MAAPRAAWAGLAMAVWLGAGSPTRALDAPTESGMRDVISRQIESFRRDDAEGAFALAAPGLRDMFGSADRFMGMVRDGYDPVYRPQTFAFGPARDGETGPEQSVRLRDRSGTEWDAVYTFEKGDDGSWRISSCRLVKAPGESV